MVLIVLAVGVGAEISPVLLLGGVCWFEHVINADNVRVTIRKNIKNSKLFILYFVTHRVYLF